MKVGHQAPIEVRTGKNDAVAEVVNNFRLLLAVTYRNTNQEFVTVFTVLPTLVKLPLISMLYLSMFVEVSGTAFQDSLWCS